MKVLIVDDSKAMRLIVLRALRKAGLPGLESAEASTGAEALTMVQSGSFDLVLSDWNMPEMNGYELLTALRAAGSKVTFGFITSEISSEIRQAAIQAGAKFLLSKPFSADDLRDAIVGPTV